jgi:hypothetical protein
MSTNVASRKKPGHNAVKGVQGFQSTTRHEPTGEQSLGAEAVGTNTNGWGEPTPKGIKAGPYTRRHTDQPVLTLDGIEVTPQRRPISDKYVAQTKRGVLVMTYAAAFHSPDGQYAVVHETFSRDGYRIDTEVDDDQNIVDANDTEQSTVIAHGKHLLTSPPEMGRMSLIAVPSVEPAVVEPIAEADVLNERHPAKVNDRGETVYQAHCTHCGEFVDETEEMPPSDYLCDECLDGYANQ